MTQASEGPNYSAFTHSICVPFTNVPLPDGRGITPAISVKVDNILIENVGLDSGSTIFALDQKLVPQYKEEGHRKGLIEYESGIGGVDGYRYEGYWVPVKVTFGDTVKSDEWKNTATSEIDLLVVNKKYDNNVLLEGEGVANTHYIGISFGYDFAPGSGFTPDKNPLLAVKHFNNSVIADKTFRAGYILHKKSVEIGLTAKNTESFKWKRLDKRKNKDIDWYWDPLSFELSINDSAWMQGNVLLDTGVTKMLIASPKYEDDPNIFKNDNPDPVEIKMRFSSEDTSFPEFSFEWPGNGEPGLPSQIHYQKSINTSAFVNTGQNFYDKFDTMFDADGGCWGIKVIA